MIKPKPRKRVECNHCGYSWKTSSKKLYVSCPNCLNKVRVYQLESHYPEEPDQDGSTIRGKIRQRQVGRTITEETTIVKAPMKAMLLESGCICSHCGEKIDARKGYKTEDGNCYHAKCLVEISLLDNDFNELRVSQKLKVPLLNVARVKERMANKQTNNS